ncbi:hypothetical protein MAPG_01010 [Magnaporthiopsis poae ATCC 64411]|uniref:Folliculin-interacting protein N-terminal domain-containing protein n=1 Tax=Magnaporthiopsis poae (strain ATCC 64411 / 73-15) TaxID=644358 RepID=A0A0C4DMK1_MAGP6|nr:hypothetical protein MAPG_01010 [Magnaporthiopsis poae ATCC 64411]
MLGKLFNLTAGAAGDASPSAYGPGSSSPSKHILSLESVQEDMHTRNLLFPDAESLYRHRNDQVFPLSAGPHTPSASATNSFDYDSDVDIDPRDVRILIMQDALSSMHAALIYDSQAPPPPTSPPADRPSTVAGFASNDPRRQPVSPRKTSVGQASRPLVIQQDGQQQQQQSQPRQGAFDRRASMQGRPQPRIESDSQRAHREYVDELNVFSSCIFGNSELMAYKGTSTKVHVVPSDPRSDFMSSTFGDGRGSLGRGSGRSSKLSQSFSSETVGNFMPQMSAAAPQRFSQRKKVLITRLFPVTLPNVEETVTQNFATPHSRFSEDSTGFPFPQHAGDDGKPKKKLQPKQKRTPMYAVALIINLPQGASQSGQNNISASRQIFRGSGSYNEHDSFPSSFGSSRRSGWTMVGQGMAADAVEPSYVADIEDRIDPITQHWDVIMRTLTHLQSVVATKLYGMLRQLDLASPDHAPSAAATQVSRQPSLSRRRSDDGPASKPQKTNAKVLALLQHCLMEDQDVQNEVDLAKARIVSGLRATRVTTGQNRWGIWREEARWVARWAGGKEHGFFFYNLLTGYLATHTDWLQALGPSYYRKRHLHQARARGEEDMALPARTVIVSTDKMAARRLIFLLAAFLPTNQQVATNLRPHRPSTSAASFGGAFSHSPPSYVVPIPKEESLRRKINRRAAPRRASHSRTTSLQSQAGRGGAGGGVPAQLAHLSMDRGGHERRSSDAISIRTTQLPMSSSDSHTRKSSAATAATIAPEATIPHFSTLQTQQSLPRRRPGSANSVAADDLKRTLQRGDSSGLGQGVGSNGGVPGIGDNRPNSSTWGVLAGLWSARRRESRGSTDMSSPVSATPMSPTKAAFRPQQESPRYSARTSTESRVARTVIPRDGVPSTGNDGARAPSEDRAAAKVAEPRSPVGDSPLSPRVPRLARLATDEHPSFTPPPRSSATFARLPDPAGAFESPVKTSINADDGVIDVDVPFPDYITSFETAVSSPSSSGYLSTPGGSGLELFEHSSRLAADGDLPFNVAGWLQHYHPDFILQAVPPQGGLEEQIKASLRAEPSPPMPASSHSLSLEPQQERWVDVSSVIVADTTTLSIKRIRYRRLVKPKPPPPELGGPGSLISASSVYTHGSAAALLTPAVSPYETTIEDRFVEEPIVTLDEVLVEAVERVVGHGVVGGDQTTTGSRRGNSASSSRSASKRRDRSNSESTEAGVAARPRPAGHHHPQHHQYPSAAGGAACRVQDGDPVGARGGRQGGCGEAREGVAGGDA